jgi:hypothetical protein
MSALLDQPTPGIRQFVDFSGLTKNTNYSPAADYSIVLVPAKQITVRGGTFRSGPTPDEITFQVLAGNWRRQTGHHSILEQKILHPYYQQIIGMGEKALPYLIKALDYKPSHWFWALRAITRENPAKDASTVDQAVQAWRDWWSNRTTNLWQSGYLPIGNVIFQS